MLKRLRLYRGIERLSSSDDQWSWVHIEGIELEQAISAVEFM